MKIIFALLALSTSAFAQGIIQTQFNGIPYTCTPSGGGNPGENARTCADAAYHGPFSMDQSMRLCAGAINNAPAECAIKAYQGPFSQDEAIQLCTGAYSTGSVDCAISAYQGPFSKPQAIQLCSGPYASARTAQCAIDAYHGPYNQDQAIQLCRGTSKRASTPLSKEKFNELARMANEKAVREGVYKK